MNKLVNDQTADNLAELTRILDAEGLHAALTFLNGRTPHRFTGIYRFDGDILRNVHLVDVYTPEVRRGDDAAMDATYCSLVKAEDAPFATPDARTDERLQTHPARDSVISYCGVLLRDAAGVPYGTLCHFDLQPCEVPHGEMPLMEAAAPHLMRALTA